jgi:hypothetical protein
LLYKSEFNPREITLEYKVSADLNARVLHEDKNYSWTLYELSAFKLEGVGISPEVLEALRPYYESMFLVKYDVSGKILEMNFSAMKENVVGLEQLTYLLEMINLEKKSYKLSQDDSMGEYVALYKKDKQQLYKYKNHYSKVINPNESYSIKVKNFHALAEIDTEGNWIKKLDLKESLEVTNKDNNSRYAHNTNTIALNKLDSFISKDLEIYKESRSVDEILKAFSQERAKDISIFELLADMNTKKYFKESKATVDSLAKNIFTSSDYFEIKEYIRLFPDDTEQLKRVILDANESTSMRLIAMLPLTNTVESQKLLISIATDDKARYMDKIRSIIALGEFKMPVRESIDTLTHLSTSYSNEQEEDLANTALLALATYAKNSDKQEEVSTVLRAEYVLAENLSKEKTLLLAMQNAGAEHFIDEIGESLQSSSMKIRMLAIETLSTIEDKEFRDSLLKQELQTQKDIKLVSYIQKMLEKR